MLFEHGLKLETIKMTPKFLHAVIYRNHCRCFCPRKHCVRLWRNDDGLKLKTLQPTPFSLEKSSVKREYFSNLTAFQCE